MARQTQRHKEASIGVHQLIIIWPVEHNPSRVQLQRYRSGRREDTRTLNDGGRGEKKGHRESKNDTERGMRKMGCWRKERARGTERERR